MRCAQDSLNPRTHGDIMVLSREDDPENAHPFWYTRIVGIFHAMVTQKVANSRWSKPKKLEFLFVRWFGLDTVEPGGWRAKRLHQIGFLDSDDPSAFGFLLVGLVISLAHPLLDHRRTKMRTGFVTMSACGGVGHASTRAATDMFKKDRDAMDISSRDSRQKQHTEAQEGEDQDNPDVDENQTQGCDDDELSESELIDYGYEDEEENDEEGEQGEDDNEEEPEEGKDGGEGVSEDLATLGYAEY
ncbi:hypothetical protein GALMADRAFT_282494 [Galerina marginata CBS 339.88]|uniref:Uncharacterized protein n=1 Tax=Galerina marginata (strain CBS 339.88) TaxID=685588 RepID=A0A067SQ04_GALM3|nr:hypothetical protein GALMADRAFT_282494 [Galerina marginata CBS 339.88]